MPICKPLVTMTKSVTISYLWLIGILLGCTSSETSLHENRVQKIKLPILVNFPKSGSLIDTNAQLESISFPLNCIAKQGTTITYVDSIDYHEFKTVDGETYMYYWKQKNRNNDGLELYVDVKHPIAWKYWEAFPFESLLIEIDEEGNEIPKKPYQPPYKKVIKFPVYIYNSTDSTQAIENQDGRLILVQEALTKDNKWKAIEYFEYSGCGNSYGIIPLPSHSLLMFGINKYSGNYKTKLRVRLKSNGQMFLSNEFDGYINIGQFEEDAETIRFGHDRYLNE